MQFIVARRWSPPFNLARDPISDLGNSACGPYSGRYVCSPLHALMNGSFVALGVAMIVGCVLESCAAPRTLARSIGFTFLGVGGVGTILVGIFPENTSPLLHGVGAAMPFLLGNVGLSVLGLGSALSRPLRVVALIAGLGSLIALALFVRANYLGLGDGGMERLVAYPQTVWLIMLGVIRLKCPPGEGRTGPPIIT